MENGVWLRSGISQTRNTHTYIEREGLTLKFDVFVWISNQPSMSIARMNASNNKKKLFFLSFYL